MSSSFTRADMSQAFLESSAVSPWKTFVLEVHDGGGSRDEVVSQIFSDFRVAPTEDAFIHIVTSEEFTIFVDHLETRFWSLHTDARVDDVSPALQNVVQRRRDIDWMWLPSQHLRAIWPGTRPTWLRSEFKGKGFLPDDTPIQDLQVQLRGESADEVIALIKDRYSEAVSYHGVATRVQDPDLGVIHEGLNRRGRFVVRGDSFEFHQQVVSGVVGRYAKLIRKIEDRRIRFSSLEDGGAGFEGVALGIQFSRPIPDIELFIDHLFSSREPFRLWGIPRMKGNIAEVEGVDLHVGDRIRLDIAQDWMRIYLFENGCGNTVARLITNLQHHFDGGLSLADPELNSALGPPPGLGGPGESGLTPV